MTRSFTYDAAGSVISSAGITFTYDGRERLKQAGSTTFAVNGLGQRVRKAGAAEVFFAYDEAGRLIGEYDATGAAITETVWLGETPVAVLKTNGAGFDVYYVWSDHLNTPRLITDAASQSRWEWPRNEAFGNNAPNENPAGLGIFAYNLRFPGQYYDVETGSNYNYFRDYDPSIGRYLESDPVGLRGGISTFAYVLNDPLAGIDQYGLWSTAAHVELINRAFPYITEDQRAALITASARVDSLVRGNQADENAFMHAMSSSKLSKYEACTKFNDFVAHNLALYARAREKSALAASQGNRGMQGIYDRDAYLALGTALHAISDSTSPAHAGFQKWNAHSADFYRHGDFGGSVEDRDALLANPMLMNQTIELMRSARGSGQFSINCSCYR